MLKQFLCVFGAAWGVVSTMKAWGQGIDPSIHLPMLNPLVSPNTGPSLTADHDLRVYDHTHLASERAIGIISHKLFFGSYVVSF